MKRIGLVVLALGVAGANPASAAPAEHNLKLFGGMAYVSPLTDNSIDGISESVEASDEIGYEFGIEWKPFRRFGFEASYVDATHDIELDNLKIGEVALTPVNLTLNWHLISGTHFDWYVGPTAAWVDWGDIELVNGDELSTDSDTTYGLSTGIDIGLGESFAIFGGLRWLDAGVETDLVDDDEFGVDPLFARLGVAFRF
jgi:hypothetical protein